MKKLLFFAFAIILSCLFIVGVNATTIYKDADGNQLFSYEVNGSNIITTYQGEFPKYDGETALTWYVTGSTTENGNTVKTVACVPTLDANYATLSDGKYSYKGGVSAQNKVVSVCFPNDSGITKLNLSNSGYRNSNTYTYSPGVSEILFVYLPNTLTELPERIVQGSMALVCDIPFECTIPKISHVNFHHAKCLREIKIPASVTIVDGKSSNDGAAFYECVSLERVIFEEGSVCTAINSYAFHKCNNLSYVNIPNSVTTIGAHAFSYTSIIESPFSEGSRCTTIGGRAFSDNTALKSVIVPAGLTKVDILGDNNYGPFADCPNIDTVIFGNSIPANQITLQPSFFGRAGIKKITLPEGITHIPNSLFIDASIKEVKFPNTVLTMDQRVFWGATVEVIRLGASFTHFTSTYSNHQAFTNAAKGIKEFYIPNSFYASAPSTSYKISYVFQCGDSNNIKFFYVGSQEDLNDAITIFKAQEGGTDNNYKFLGATQVDYNVYKQNPSNYESGNYIIYNYNNCDAFYSSIHEEDNNTCMVNCDRCNTYNVQEKNPVHAFSSTVEYENGFSVTGIITHTCGNTGCPLNITPQELEAAPIFNGYKYSTRIDESKGVGLVLSYNISREAVKVYNDITGTQIKYGVVATFEKALKGNQPADADTKIMANISDGSVSRVDFIIRGSLELWGQRIEEGSDMTVKDLPLYMLGYVEVNGNIKYFYSSSESADATSLTTISYSSISQIS